MKIWTGVILVSSGVQTVTDIVDRTGAAFLGKLAFFQGGRATLNAIAYQSGLVNAYADVRGADDATYRMAAAGADIGRHGNKIGSVGNSTQYSVLDLQADDFFAGNWQRYGYVSAFRVGEMDITWDLANFAGRAVLVTVFGDTDYDIAYANGLASGSVVTPSAPQGIFNMGAARPMTAGGTELSKGAGSPLWGYGWDTRDGIRGSVSFEVQHFADGGQNYRGCVTDRCGVSVAGGAVGPHAPVVSTWSPLGYTITGSAAPGLPFTTFAFCGATLLAKAGTFQQSPNPGLQVIDLGIDAYWVCLVSAGTIPPAVAADYGAFALGWTDGHRNCGFWTGEASTTVTTKGARYATDAALLTWGIPNGALTTITSVAALSSLATTGLLTLDWSLTDGVDRTWLWFALGFAATPITPTVPDGCPEVLPVAGALPRAGCSEQIPPTFHPS